MWGIENKEAPIRLVTSLKPKEPVKQFEIKSFDHTCNMYFGLAACIVYGIRGLRDKLKLPKPFDEDVDLMTSD